MYSHSIQLERFLTEALLNAPIPENMIPSAGPGTRSPETCQSESMSCGLGVAEELMEGFWLIWDESPNLATTRSTRPSVLPINPSRTSLSPLPQSSSPTPIPNSPPAASLSPLNISTAGLPCNNTSQLQMNASQNRFRKPHILDLPTRVYISAIEEAWCRRKIWCARRICCRSRAGGQTSRAEYSTGIAPFRDWVFMIVSEELGRRVKSTDCTTRISQEETIEGMTAYCQEPPIRLKLVKDDSRFFCFNRIYRFAIGEAPENALSQEAAFLFRTRLLCEFHHSLSEANLSFFLVPLLSSVLAITIVIGLAAPPGICGSWIVVHNLFVKSIVRFAQGRIVYGQKGEACRNNACDGVGHRMMSNWRNLLRWNVFGEKSKKWDDGYEWGDRF